MFDIPSVAMFTAVIQTLIFWLFVLFLILGLVVGPKYIRSRDRQKMYELMRLALEKGQPLPPDLVAQLSQDEPAPVGYSAGPARDFRRAIVLIAVGVGLVCLGAGLDYGLSFASHVAGAIVGGIVAGIGAIPGFIGVAYLILWLANRGAARA